MYRIILSFIVIILFSVSLYADDIIVAKVNGIVLTQKDLDNELDRMLPQITYHRDLSAEKRKKYYSKALEGLINRELQYQDAIAKGMRPDKEKVNAQIKDIKNRLKIQEVYKAYLEKIGGSEEKLHAQVEKEVLIQTVFAKMVTQPAEISEEELKVYYEKNTSRFKQPESVRLRIISTKDEKKAKDVLAKIKSGEDFGDLAYTMSEDSYRVKSGDIGYMHKGRMLPEIENVAFKLNVGEVSDLIKSEESWFIIKVEDKKTEQQIPFDEIKGKLKKDIETGRARDLEEKWIADLRAKAKIEVFLTKE